MDSLHLSHGRKQAAYCIDAFIPIIGSIDRCWRVNCAFGDMVLEKRGNRSIGYSRETNHQFSIVYDSLFPHSHSSHFFVGFWHFDFDFPLFIDID